MTTKTNINPTREFCNWFQGVLDMAGEEGGAVTFTKLQAAKIQTKLNAALSDGVAGLQHPSSADAHARC